MTQADCVHSTPPKNTPILPDGLVQQQRARERTLKRIAKLREKASAEIERLIDFLDASDPYAAHELEQAIDDEPCDGDELEVSWVGVGASTTELSWADECEADYGGREADFEPSLGSVDGPDRGGQTHWAQGAGVADLEDQCEDEGVRV